MPKKIEAVTSFPYLIPKQIVMDTSLIVFENLGRSLYFVKRRLLKLVVCKIVTNDVTVML
jgi:hypothetical protein